MNRTPLVSVIIPNYNHAHFLDLRLQSVLNQTYQNYEVIILDDNSTDNSLEIINKYKSNSHVVQIVVNSTNTGSPFKQWRKGFSIAKGDLIWIAESDDYCENTLLEKLVDKFINYPDVVVAFCRTIQVDENGEFVKEMQSTNSLTDFYTGSDFLKKKLQWRNTIINASSALFKKNVALSLHEYLNMKSSGDWLFWIEMTNYGNVCVEKEALNYYRRYSTNTTQTNIVSGGAYKQDIIIYNYLQSHRLINKLNAIRIKKYHLLHLINNTKITDETRRQIINEWNPNLLDRCFTFFNIMKHKLIK